MRLSTAPTGIATRQSSPWCKSVTPTKSHGLSQHDLAAILHISNDEIIRWEDGDEDFTIANLAKIATLLNIRLSNLFGVIDEILVG